MWKRSDQVLGAAGLASRLVARHLAPELLWFLIGVKAVHASLAKALRYAEKHWSYVLRPFCLIHINGKEGLYLIISQVLYILNVL